MTHPHSSAPRTLRSAITGAMLLAAIASLHVDAVAQGAGRGSKGNSRSQAVNAAKAKAQAKVRARAASTQTKGIDLAGAKALTAKGTTLESLQRGAQRSLSPTEKLAILAGMPDRYGRLAASAGNGQATGKGSYGVSYTMGRAAPSLPRADQGRTTTQRTQDDLIVCKTTPVDVVKQFAGPLMIAGLPSTQNQSVIYPGALFRDADVVRGVFTPQTPARTPGSITIDVFNPDGAVVTPVANLNDRSQVATAINQLRSGAAGADANSFLEYTETVFRAAAQLSVELEAAMDANLEALLGVPVTVGSESSGSLGFETGVNVAVAALHQVYYTISLGGEGPASTISGPVGSDVVCVTDVQYGRRAFLLVGSLNSRLEASAAMSQIISLLDVASAERSLSAEAQLALDAGFVRVAIVGGDVQSAVTVRDLATLRGFIEQIEPSVGGVGAVPIGFTLRYAADNAPARVGAFAEATDHECFRAKKVRVTLVSLKPVKVVDFGDEELFGSITVDAGGTLADGSAELWSKSASKWVTGKEGQAIAINDSATYNFNPAVHREDTVEVAIAIKDLIQSDPESIGANATDRNRGYAAYERKTVRVSLGDILAGANGKLTRKVNVDEGDARIEVQLLFELL